MNRRKFAQTVCGTIGVSTIAPTIFAKTDSRSHRFQPGLKMQSSEGLHLQLIKHSKPLANQDNKQFILTFKVKQANQALHEKIYDLIDEHGKKHQIYLKPISQNQLQAEFNWRTHA